MWETDPRGRSVPELGPESGLSDPILFPAPHKPQHTLPSSLPLALLRKYLLLSYMVEGKRNDREGRWTSLSPEFGSRSECWCQRGLRRASLSLTSLPAPSVGYSQARWIGLTGPADHSVLGSLQNAPDTSAKHYKEPADNSAFFPVKVSE